MSGFWVFVGLVLGFGLVVGGRWLLIYGRDLAELVLSVLGYLGIVLTLLVTGLIWFGLILCLGIYVVL